MAEPAAAAPAPATDAPAPPDNENAPEKPPETPTEEAPDAPLGEAGEKALEAFKQRAREAEKEARTLAAKVKEFEDRDKSEQERLEERATEAEKRAATMEAKLLRVEVATAKKLPMELADRLQGDTKEALEQDADRLLELVKPNGKPGGDADAGKGEGGGEVSFNDALRAAAGRR